MTANELRRMLSRLPEVEERETWGHPTFRVRDKIFVGLAEDGTTANVKASPEDQASLTATDEETFSPAPRLGRHGWVQVRLGRVRSPEMRHLVTEAWRRTAPRALVDEFDARGAGS
jgi:hypothetical protein